MTARSGPAGAARRLLPVSGAPAWLGQRPLWQRLAAAAAAGAAMTLAQPPVSLPILLFVALPVLLWLLEAAASGRQALFTGWAAGFGYFVSGLHWMGHAFLVDPDRFAWMMPFAVTLLPAFLGLFWAAAFVLARRLFGLRRWQRALSLAAGLALAELARSHVLTGFPWALPGYAWIETPAMQGAAWLGPQGMTLLTLALCTLPLGAGLRSPAAWAALGGIAALWVAGSLRLALPEPEPQATVLRIVQPNAEQHLKWQRGHREGYHARQMALTAAPPDPALGPPDAVIWPETAITFLPQDRPEELVAMARAAKGAMLLTGALFYEWQGEQRRWSNELMALGPDGTVAARYAKHHLVPFGEYLPLHGLLSRLGIDAIAGMGGAGFAAGPGPRGIEAGGLPRFAPAICYEMIFARGIVGPGPRPQWILQVTNDAWFGRFAGPQQHLAQARIRAIEQGLPAVRSANTGISAVIDARGRVVASLPLGTHGALDARLPGTLPPTLYARTGDLPALTALALLLGFSAATARRRGTGAA